MKLLYLHRAVIGLQQAHAWGCYKFGAKYGNRFSAKLRKEIRRLIGHPELGEIYESRDGIVLRRLVIHEFIKAEYYYDPLQDCIVVTHIFDVRLSTNE